jgi:hypothetical protein
VTVWREQFAPALAKGGAGTNAAAKGDGATEWMERHSRMTVRTWKCATSTDLKEKPSEGRSVRGAIQNRIVAVVIDEIVGQSNRRPNERDRLQRRILDPGIHEIKKVSDCCYGGDHDQITADFAIDDRGRLLSSRRKSGKLIGNCRRYSTIFDNLEFPRECQAFKAI